jgi:Arc/MetJ-type ribon-helix-helix transcriptional regulator
MEVHPTPGQEAFIRQAIESGRINRPEDAVQQALFLWEENERRRTDILAAVDEAEDCIKQGKITVVTSELQAAELAEATKRRGMARLLAEQTTSR